MLSREFSIKHIKKYIKVLKIRKIIISDFNLKRITEKWFRGFCTRNNISFISVRPKKRPNIDLESIKVFIST